MADPVVFENGYIAHTTSTGGTVYTEFSGVKSISMPISRAELDDSVMGDNLEAKYPGILAVPISVTARQDFTSAVTGVDKLTYTRLNARTAFKLKIRPVDSAVSASNPTYIWSKVRIFSTTPIDGAHGVALENKIELRAASGCAFSRSTST